MYTYNDEQKYCPSLFFEVHEQGNPKWGPKISEDCSLCLPHLELVWCRVVLYDGGVLILGKFWKIFEKTRFFAFLNAWCSVSM